MSFGLMSPSVLCRSRPYVIRVNVSFGYVSFRFNVVRQPVVRTNVVHVTVGVRKLLSGGAKRMNRCVLYCISVFKMSTKPFGAKVRVQSGETVKMHMHNLQTCRYM